MWFLWLNWRKSTFYPITAPNGSKCWPIVVSSIQEPVASNCDVTMTVVAMDAFLAQWWGQWSQHSGRPITFLALMSLLKHFFILFCDPRASTRGIASCCCCCCYHYYHYYYYYYYCYYYYHYHYYYYYIIIIIIIIIIIYPHVFLMSTYQIILPIERTHELCCSACFIFHGNVCNRLPN